MICYECCSWENKVWIIFFKMLKKRFKWFYPKTFLSFTTRDPCFSSHQRFESILCGWTTDMYLRQDVCFRLSVWWFFYLQVQTWRCWVAGRCGRWAWTTATAQVTVLETTLEFMSVCSRFIFYFQSLQPQYEINNLHLLLGADFELTNHPVKNEFKDKLTIRGV